MNTQDLFENAFKNSSTGKGLVSFEGKFIKVNKILEKLFGYTEEELYTMKFIDVTHEDDIELSHQQLKKLKNKEVGHINFEKRCIHKSGKIIWVDINVSMSLNDEGEGFFISELQDITEKKENKEQLGLIMENSFDGHWDWHINEDYEYMSPRFWEILGFLPHEKKHHPSEWQKQIYPEDLPLAFQNFQEHVESKGEIPFSKELRFYHKSGETVWIQCEGRVVQWDHKGAPVRVVGYHRDITEIKKIREALEHQKLREQKLNHLTALGEMAGGIAHEINNPLAIINGQADILLKSLEKELINKERILKSSNSIKETVTRIDLIVKGLKNFTKSGDKDAMEEFDILEVLDEVKEICRSRYSNTEIDFTYNDSGVKIFGQKVQISQVLINLINNSFYAIKDQPGNKWVRLETQDYPQHTKVLVIDSGNGIDQEIIDKIMNPFFTTKPNEEGSGVGLSISKNIIEKHDGSLLINSSSPNTCFEIILPKKGHQK